MSQATLKNGVLSGAGAANETERQFSIHSLYVKDLSFESPHAPHIFHESWAPKVDFDLQMGSQVLSEEEHVYEVVLHITVTVKLGEGESAKSAFLVDLQQAGAFSAIGFSPEELNRLLATTAAAVIFPYARETIASLGTRGGFPQLVLPPINFEAMYEQHLNNQANSQSPLIEPIVN